MKVEERIRYLNVARNHMKLPSEYWSQGMSLDEIFEDFESTEDILFDINYLFQLLQKCIMLNRLEVFLEILQQNIEGIL